MRQSIPVRRICWMPPRVAAALMAFSIVAVIVGVNPVRTAAQGFRFFYPAPSAASIEVLKDRGYGTLQMDAYRPAKVDRPLPALIFFNIASGAQRSQPFYKAWAEIAAATNVVAILPDLRSESFARDFDRSSLTSRRTQARWASIAIASRCTPVPAMSRERCRWCRSRSRRLKAAVMYDGSARVTAFRHDLPLLIVRAGLDRPPLNRDLTALVAQATNQNAPVTLLNYPGGHHAFEMVDDEDATRETIDRTLAFVVRATEPAYQASLARGAREATAAAQVILGNFADAASTYAELVKTRPDDTRLRLSYGEALLGAGRYADACGELEQLKGKGLGPRDLGVPAARACMQKGDGDAAVAWLSSIPQPFRTAKSRNRPDLRTDSGPARVQGAVSNPVK